jgi:uncharacterized membrane protein SpoIIM required for sporulation
VVTLSDPGGTTERFEALLNRCERVRLHGLPFDELRELGRLYRLHASRLARLREREEDPEAIRYLNALCVRAYTLLYGSPREEGAGRRPLLSRLPDLLGRTWRAQALAWILLLGGMVIGGVLAHRDPESLYVLVPASLGYGSEDLDRLVASPAARASFLKHETPPASWNMIFGSFLFVHNTKVGLLSFATGILAGVPTVLLQLYNGMMVGAFASIFLRDPRPLPFLAWILPHGIPELTAVTLCASAGLLLGGAVAAPERRSRAQALRDSLQPALLLFAAAIPLFAAAAFIESFVRQSHLSATPRFGIAAGLATALAAGLIAVRRLARRRLVDTRWLGQITARVRNGSRDTGSAPTPSAIPARDPASAAPDDAAPPARPPAP